MNNKYLTVKEFAARAGVSKQAVYNRINQVDSIIQPFVVKVKNRTMIDIAAIDKFKPSQVESTNQSRFNQVESPADDDNYTKMLDILQQQLEVKDKQIKDLNNRLAELSNIINSQQTLLDQQQKLNLIDKKEMSSIQETEKAKENTDQKEQQEKKKGFFARLFNI